MLGKPGGQVAKPADTIVESVRVNGNQMVPTQETVKKLNDTG